MNQQNPPHQVWPLPARTLDDDALEALYTYPADASRWVAVSFVSSLDGAIEVDGRSASLSTPGDRIVYQLASDLADVVLLGAGTAVAESYAGLRPSPGSRARRARHGLSEVPPLALVTSGPSLPPDAVSLTDVLTPSIVLTCESAGAEARGRWADTGARVIVTGDGDVDLHAALDALADDGLRRVDCEGGPSLVGALLADDLADEMRLSYSPMAVAGQASRVARTPEPLPTPVPFTLASALIHDGTIMSRYLRAAPS